MHLIKHIIFESAEHIAVALKQQELVSHEEIASPPPSTRALIGVPGWG